MSRKTSMLPMPTDGGGGSTGSRVLGILAGITVFALVLRDPVGAAHAVERGLAWAGSALDALVQFTGALSGE